LGDIDVNLQVVKRMFQEWKGDKRMIGGKNGVNGPRCGSRGRAME